LQSATRSRLADAVLRKFLEVFKQQQLPQQLPQQQHHGSGILLQEADQRLAV
jgi:hypothetical protein